MKKYSLGFLVGYLVTSFLVLEFPPVGFWLIVGFFATLFSVGKYVQWRINDDQRNWG